MGHRNDYSDLAHEQHAACRFRHAYGRANALEHERDLERLPGSDIRISMGTRSVDKHQRRDFIVLHISRCGLQQHCQMHRHRD